MTSITLTYFEDNKGRNELIRLIFAVGKVRYENENLGFQEYTARRDANELPFGQLPTMKVDGTTYGQSCALARYAARVANLYPTKNGIDALITDGIVDSWRDNLDLYYDTVFGRVVIRGKLTMFPHPTHERRSRLDSYIGTEYSATLARYETMLSKGDAGSEPQFCHNLQFPSWADLAVYDLVKTIEMVAEGQVHDAIMVDKPKVKALIARVDQLEEVRTHLEKHPYKNMRSFFAPVPFWKRALESVMLPLVKTVLGMPVFAVLQTLLGKKAHTKVDSDGKDI